MYFNCFLIILQFREMRFEIYFWLLHKYAALKEAKSHQNKRNPTYNLFIFSAEMVRRCVYNFCLLIFADLFACFALNLLKSNIQCKWATAASETSFLLLLMAQNNSLRNTIIEL